jgi:glucose-1-phosphate cytidylyltransferase
MKMYAHYGLHDFVLCLGYRGNMIKDYLLNYEAMNNDFTICLGRRSTVEYNGSHSEQDFRVTLADTGQESMTGGRIQRIRRYVEGETFLVTYGDGLADLNIRALIEYHRHHGKLATVTTVRPISRFGSVTVDDRGDVKQFMEKPRSDAWISAGFFVLEPGVFDYIDGDDCIFEREPLENLAADGQLRAFRHDGFFYAMDTYREYQYLNDEWASGRAPWKVWA